MIPKIIHQVNFGGVPSPQIAAWMETVRRHHPDWQVIIWHENDIGQLGLNVEALKFDCQNWAGVSNIVRLHALNDFGGIYLDLDCEVLKPLDPLLENDAFAAMQDSKIICNAVLGASANHPWTRWQIAREQMLRCQDAATGCYLTTEAPRDGVTIVPKELFFPWTHETPIEQRKPHPDSFLIHHFLGSWL